jgi:hypothetical protein
MHQLKQNYWAHTNNPKTQPKPKPQDKQQTELQEDNRKQGPPFWSAMYLLVKAME